MIDVNPTIVAKLKTIGLPVYYEMFIDTSTVLPCITYIETLNTDYLVGNTIEYSNLVYQIKVWTKDLKVATANAILIDSKMKELGFIRDFSNQLVIDGLIQYILRYKSIGFLTN